LLKGTTDTLYKQQWRSQNKAMVPRNKLAKISTGVFYQFSTVRKMSVTDDIIDWPLPKKIIGCTTEKQSRRANIARALLALPDGCTTS